tara:strand:- start:38 stop:424 length:387 start_codon:yes stop_codon:yes gene_type:complete
MFIYRIFNDTHSYVGSTKNLKNRMSSHKTPSSECMARFIINEGLYDVEILEECDDESRLDKEQYWMDKFDNLINTHNTYNTKKWDKNPVNALFMKNWKRENRYYQKTWGGDRSTDCNLLSIDDTLFLN